MKLSTPMDPHHVQLRAWHDRLTARIAELEKDISRELDSERKFILKERRADLVADRDLVTAYLGALEHDQPLPGPWPPEFQTADLLSAPPPRILFKSGRCDFYRHIPLPPNYIPRPELLAEVRERLLAGTGNLALTSAIQVRQADVLHGMGGIGKSVLARALCDDPDVQAAFPDGILWATLGQTPDLTARLREWIETLGGIVGQTAPTLDQLRNTLAEALRDKACLMIVDDAWRKAHLEPFCAGGSHCRLLITTRDAALAEGLGAGVYPVTVMAPDQAVLLLEEWAQGGLAQVEAEVKTKIAGRLGCLPLAVRLAGAQLRQKDPVEWLASFDARKLKTRRVERVHDSLEATFGLSLDALSPADRRLYVALAIFKEDEPVPVVAIARLWSALDGRDADETAGLLADLTDHALVSRSQRDGTAITLHDLLRDFMAVELGTDGHFAAHQALLDAYRSTRTKRRSISRIPLLRPALLGINPSKRIAGCWHTAPDDGYLYNHLAYHLDQLADHDPAAEAELSALFTDHFWLHARIPQSDYFYDGYLNDLEIAWHRSHAAVDHHTDTNEETSNLADCVRYALIRTSINTLAANYIPELVARAVEIGAWSTDRALSVTSLIPDPDRRAAAYTALLGVPGLLPGQRRQAECAALAAALAIDGEPPRVQALTALASQLTGETREVALQAALTAALAIRYADLRVEALVDLVPQLSGETREGALQAALAAAQAIGDEEPRAKALNVLAPHLTDKLLLVALVLAEELGDERLRVLTLAALTPHLTDEARAAALAATLTAALELDDKWFRGRVLAALAPHLTGEARAAALTAMLATDNEWFHALALVAMAPHLTGETLWAALATAQEFGDEYARAQVLAALAPYLPDEAREAALQAALAPSRWRDYHYGSFRRPQALAALAPHLTGETMRAALVAARALSEESYRAEALAALAPHLTGELLQGALVDAQKMHHEGNRVRALIALTPQLTGETLRSALVAKQELGDEWARAGALTALAPQLTGETLRAALATAQTMADEWPRAVVLAALAPHLPGELHEIALRAALTAWLAISNERGNEQALVALAPHLTGELLQAALTVALAICNEWDRTQALVVLAPHLTGELLQVALTAAQAISNEWDRTWALVALAPHLTSKLLLPALAAAQAIRDERCRAKSMAAVAPQLAGEVRVASLRSALTAAQAISDDTYRAETLAELAPHLAGKARETALAAALAAAQAISDNTYRVKILVALAPQLTGKAREATLAAALVAAQAICDDTHRAEALTVLAPHLTGELLQAALATVQVINSGWSRARALATLAPYLTGELLQGALAAAKTIHAERDRAQALAALLPHVLDANSCLRAIRQAIADHLRNNLADRKREDVLRFIADDKLFAPPILSPDTLAAIAGHIIEICTEWEWL